MAHSVVSPLDASLTQAPNLTSSHHNLDSASSQSQLSRPATDATSLGSISPNLMWMLMSSSANLTNLLFASSTGVDIDSVVSSTSSSISPSSQYYERIDRSESLLTATAASLMHHTTTSSAPNQSEHQHSVITKDSHTWLATYLVEANMPHSVGLNYLSLCLLPVSLLLNLYLCLAIFCGRTHRSRTNSLMQNIFVSDLLLVAFSLPFEVHLQLQTSLSYFGHIGHLLCKVVPSLQIITEFVTAASITILTVDKCQSIIAKHNYRITNVFSVVLLTKLIWLTAIILCVPIILYSDLFSLHSESHFRFSSVCRLDLTSLVAPTTSNSGPRPVLTSLVQPTALVLYFCILYLIPLLITFISHGKTYLHLFQHSHRYSHVHDLQKRIRTSDREAVRMLSVVVVIFALTWLPFHLVQIVSQFVRPFQQHEPELHIWSVLYICTRQLTILATCLTPVVYLLFSRPLREQFIDHICVAFQFIIHPSLKKYHLRTYGPSSNSTSSTSSNSSSSSASSSTCPTAPNSEGGNCKNNSLQKLLPKSPEENRSLV